MRDSGGADVFRVIVRGILAIGIAMALAGIGAGAAGANSKPLKRPADPIVLTGAQVPRLLGIAPGTLAAYRVVEHRRAKGKGAVAAKLGRRVKRRWSRVPVQVDERALVDFGSQPPSNATPPSGAATVYGTAPIGVTALQYTDPSTFVGPDPDPSMDGNDEIAMMASDAGAKAPKSLSPPLGAVQGGATAITVGDPLTGGRGRIYLFRVLPKPKPKPPKTDYVDYEFQLLSGDYKSTYRRADGPNPEASTVSTSEYRAGFSDRWFLDTMAIDAGAAGGQDILDGIKSGFAPGNCGRSEATYNDAEGAFIANRDGPVRAIRSYLGANSGPLTQRTDVFYAGRHEARIDLRVHSIGSIFSYMDLSPAAFGMSYRSAAAPGGVTVNGVGDAVTTAPAAWHLWSGSQGSLFSSNRLTTSIGAVIAAGTTTGFYRDELNTGIQQCWGDDDLIGAAGTHITPAGGLPNTDPRNPPAATFHAETVNLLSAPGAGTTEAGAWYQQLGAPLATSAKKFSVKKNRRR